MKILDLADSLQHLPTLAAWQHDAFGHLNPSLTLEARTARLAAGCSTPGLPLTLVAVSDGGEPLGSASVTPKSLTHEHLGPWLSAVFVAPAHRGRGVASALSLKALDAARDAGFETLYLFTPRNESLYARLGWRTFERAQLQGRPIALMARGTAAQG